MMSLRVWLVGEGGVSVRGGICPGGSLPRGVSVRETPLYGKERAVRTLLESILV